MYDRFGKRALDILVASFGLIATLPLLAICGWAIKRDSPGPVLFRQRRAGRFGKPFTILKLRTMVVGQRATPSTVTTADDPRVTRIGRTLRRYKVDEIPQLINVLRGEMSLVGPRPETMDFVGQYDARQRSVLDVKPGITGVAALMFFNEEEELKGKSNPAKYYAHVLMPNKIAMELAYRERLSLKEDLQLILMTAVKIAGVKTRAPL